MSEDLHLPSPSPDGYPLPDLLGHGFELADPEDSSEERAAKGGYLVFKEGPVIYTVLFADPRSGVQLAHLFEARARFLRMAFEDPHRLADPWSESIPPAGDNPGYTLFLSYLRMTDEIDQVQTDMAIAGTRRQQQIAAAVQSSMSGGVIQPVPGPATPPGLGGFGGR